MSLMQPLQYARDPESEIRAEVHAWVARFAPLVMDDSALTPVLLERRLNTLQELRAAGGPLRLRLGSLRREDDAALITTFETALSQIEGIDDDIRRQLAAIVPGHPQGKINLDALQDRLAERRAREEVGIEPAQGMALKEVVQIPQPGTAAGLGVFALGWNAFTLFHCAAMITGMWMAFGPLALFVLFFYAIFFGAGFAMAAGAVEAAKRKTMLLSGRHLILEWQAGPLSGSKEYEIPRGSRAEIGLPEPGFTFQQSGAQRQARSQPAVLIPRSGDKPIVIGSMTTHHEREQLRDKINAMLAQADAGLGN